MNFLFSLLFSLSFFTISVLSHLFSPPDTYLINCGSTVPTTLIDNCPFAGDLARKHSPLSPSSPAVSLQNDNPFPNLPPIYNTARVFTNPIRYSFPIKDKGTHIVRLHFCPFNSSKLDLGRAQFHVLLDGHVVLSNFTRFVTVSEKSPRIVEYLIWVDAEKLVIVFVPNKDSKLAFVNAIEVISAPKDLVPDTTLYFCSQKPFRVSRPPFYLTIFACIPNPAFSVTQTSPSPSSLDKTAPLPTKFVKLQIISPCHLYLNPRLVAKQY